MIQEYIEAAYYIVLNMWWFCHDYNEKTCNKSVVITMEERVTFSHDWNESIEVKNIMKIING